MQQTAAERHRLPGLDRLAETGVHVGQVAVGHFVLAITDGLADAVRPVTADGCHRTAGHGGQQAVADGKVDAVMEELFTGDGMRLFPVA